jgi:spermidine synthase
MSHSGVLFEGDTKHGHYVIADTIYSGRKARVLYSGNYRAAQSGQATDGKPDLLFDYNQRFMELIEGLKPIRLLIIGGGAFTLPKTVHERFPDTEIDVVELDDGLLPLAQEYFDFQPDEKLRVHHADGREYLDTYKGDPHDLILIDAYTDVTIPSSLQTAEAAAAAKKILTKNGVVAINIIASYVGERSQTLRRQITSLQPEFSHLDLFIASRFQSIWLPQNFVLTAHNTNRDLKPLVRYETLRLPE